MESGLAPAPRTAKTGGQQEMRGLDHALPNHGP